MLDVGKGHKENSVFPVQLTTIRMGNHNRLMLKLLKVMTTHTTGVIHLLARGTGWKLAISDNDDISSQTYVVLQ